MTYAKKTFAALLMACTLGASAADLNQASAFELEALRGIGPEMAQQIVTERATHGAFMSWQDFTARIKGVGEKNLKKMQDDGLTLEPTTHKKQ
jgi:competence protein ComEA